MNENKKKNIVKIAIPILIVILLASIWIYKNGKPEQMDEISSNPVSQDLLDIKGYFPLHVEDKIDLEELKSYGIPIIIDFGADSCMPCREMAPVLEKANEKFAGKAIILFVDVWKHQDLAEGFPVQLIPTQILIDKDGKPYSIEDNENPEYIQYKLKDSDEIAFTAHQGGLTEEQLTRILEEMGMK